MIYLKIRNLHLLPSEKLTLFILATHLPNIFPSTTKLAEETGLSRRTVQTCLNNLKAKKIIDWKKTNGSNIYRILIAHESVVQSLPNQCETIAQPLSNHFTTPVQPLHTKNTNNKQFKKKEFSDDFEKFWAAYPKVRLEGGGIRVANKQNVREKLFKLLNNGTSIEKIISDLNSFVNGHAEQERRFIPKADVWLNKMTDNGKWRDDVYDKVAVQKSVITQLKERWQKYGNIAKQSWATEQTIKQDARLIEQAFNDATEEEKKELVALAPEGVKLPNVESNLVKLQTKPTMRVV
tara:strand:+ start:7959 stop:8837 length:879 start_codon:yes stop_codon:yes gene_type:complete